MIKTQQSFSGFQLARERVCCACGTTVFRRRKIEPGEPSVIALTLIIYRRSPEGRKLKSTRIPVRVCDTCMGLITGPAGMGTEQAAQIAGALLESLIDRYSEMCGVPDDASA